MVAWSSLNSHASPASPATPSCKPPRRGGAVPLRDSSGGAACTAGGTVPVRNSSRGAANSEGRCSSSSSSCRRGQAGPACVLGRASAPGTSKGGGGCGSHPPSSEASSLGVGAGHPSSWSQGAGTARFGSCGCSNPSRKSRSGGHSRYGSGPEQAPQDPNRGKKGWCDFGPWRLWTRLLCGRLPWAARSPG